MQQCRFCLHPLGRVEYLHANGSGKVCPKCGRITHRDDLERTFIPANRKKKRRKK